MRRVLLVYPPGATDIAQPYTSLPALTAFLKREGFAVTQKDLGMDSLRFFTSKQRLRADWEYIIERFKQLRSRQDLGPDEQKESRVLAGLLRHAQTLGVPVLDDFKNAVRTIKSNRSFYDPRKLMPALRSISMTFEAMAVRAYPTSFFDMYRQRCGWTDAAKFIKALSDTKENLFLEYYAQQVVPYILKVNPEVLGISLSFFNHIIPGLTLARMVKERNKDIHICLGGNVVRYITDDLERSRPLFSCADSMILYEGETALSRLLQKLSSRRGLRSVPNLIYRDGKKIIRNPELHTEDMNALPTPSYDGLPLDDYMVPERVLVANPSRGCYWAKCAFCSMSLVKILKYRERSPELFVKDIRTLKNKYGVRRFSFNSEAVSPSWLARTSDLLIKEGLKITWDSEIRFEPAFTPEVCRKLFRAGARFFRFGLESGNQRVLDLMHKGTKLPMIRRVIRNCHSAGIRVGLETFVGFPGETQKEARETAGFIIQNKRHVQSAVIGTFMLCRGSEVSHHPERYGVRITENRNIFPYSYRYDVKSGITEQQGPQVVQRLVKKIKKAGCGYLLTKLYNDACGSVFSVLYASKYKTKRIRA